MSLFTISAEGQGVDPAPPRPAAKRIPKGTHQQEELWCSLLEGGPHLTVEARAGCGKSSSCREGMWRLLEADPALAGSVRYAVYNKANAEEFRADCPPGVEVGTVHAFGNAALKKAFGSVVEKNKSYLILDETNAGRNLPRYMRKSVAALVGAGKNQLATDHEDLRDLMDWYDINGYGRPHVVVDFAHQVLERAMNWTEVVDFDDMIWLPFVHQIEFPPVEILFIDEVQDWNPAQHALIGQLCSSGRVVAVGDRFQAIYQFRGADAESIPNLEKAFAQTDRGLGRLPLTITFRCPKSHVTLAQEYVPDIEAHEGNRDGTIVHGATLGDVLAKSLPGDKVLCPTNAPLITAALKLVASRRRALVRGRAVGDQLVTVWRSAGGADHRTPQAASLGIERWRSRELSRLSDRDGVEDQVDAVQDRASGLQAVLQSCDSPADVEPAIGRLFAEEDDGSAVNFSTIHRAKGSEADRVWLIDVPPRAPKRDWEIQQQRNLRYVALTRSRDTLTFVEPPRK